MGRRLGTIIAGVAVVALVVVAIVALTTQTGQAAQSGAQGNGAAALQAGSSTPDCSECPGQGEAQGSGVVEGCEGCGVERGAQDDGSASEGCCPY